MIIPEKAVPGGAVQFCLPAGHGLLQGGKRQLLVGPLAVLAVTLHVLELEHHVKLVGILAGILLRQFRSHACRLSDSHNVVFGQYFPVHLLQVFVNVGTVHAVRSEAAVQALNLAVRHFLCLRDHADDVHAEAVDSFVAPPGHHVEYFLSYFGIIPV